MEPQELQIHIKSMQVYQKSDNQLPSVDIPWYLYLSLLEEALFCHISSNYIHTVWSTTPH